MSCVMPPQESLAELAIQEMARRELARRDFLQYAKYMDGDMIWTQFHTVYYTILNLFAEGIIKKLIITVPPQHGKSEGSSRKLPSYLLGRKPKSKVAILSYAAAFAQGFNRDNQRIIDSPAYSNVFPDTYLGKSNIRTVSSNYLRNSTIFETVGHGGFLKAVGRGGPLTGDPVDYAIMDDLYKDAAEGNSPIIRQAVIDWYTSVVMKRLHNDSQQLIVFTRWHEDDLIGWLENTAEVITLTNWEQTKNIDPTKWYKINFPALQNAAPTEFDSRLMGEPLFPEKHSKEKLEEERKLQPEQFESMNQGDPSPTAGLLYTQGFNEWKILPRDCRIRKNLTDTADTGKDYLCSISYDVGLDGYLYVRDILFTQEDQTVTAPQVANLIRRTFVKHTDIESNNGGRGFARDVDRELKGRTYIEVYHQTENKEARVISNAPEVQRKILMPPGWKYKYPEFYKHVTRFKKLFKANAHDDGPDVLTAMIEKNQDYLDGTGDGLYNF